MPFDPDKHQMLPTRHFDDFRIGERFFAPSRTMSEGVFAAFQAASGDNHPIHYDRTYLKSLGHADLMAHGYMSLIQAAIVLCLCPRNGSGLDRVCGSIQSVFAPRLQWRYIVSCV